MHLPLSWKSTRLALLVALGTCTAPAAEFILGDFDAGSPGTTTHHTGSGRMFSSFFDVFFEVSVPSLPVDSFFDIFYDITLLHRPGPLPPGPPHMVPIELVALQLHAANPLPIQVGPQTVNVWELRTVFPPPHQNQTGPTLGTDLGGGIFRIDSFFDVFVELEIPGLSSPIQPQNGPVRLTNTVPDEAATIWLLTAALMLLGTRRLRVDG